MDLAMASEGLLAHVDVGSGPPVVLLHGFGLDARMWTAQVAALRKHHRVLVPDLPGFGPKGAEAGAFNAAAEVFRLLTAKALGPVHLVGLSFGGAVAVDLVLSHPEAVRTLSLIDALLLGEQSGLEGWRTCLERAKQGDFAGAREVWLKSSPFERLLIEPQTAARTRAMVESYPGGHWRGTVQSLWTHETPRPLLPGIACPTQVLVGELDLATFQAMAALYVAAIPGARLVELAGLGHLGPMEAPGRISLLLEGFFHERDGAPVALPASARLEFRTWRQGGLELGTTLWGDARVTAFIASRALTAAQVEARLQEEVERQAADGMQYWPMFLRSSGALVGCCGFRPRASGGVLELGFLLRPGFWGQGLATEAAHAALGHAFDVLGASAIFAGHHPENSASQNVLEKLGFRHTHREFYPPTGLQHPSYLLTEEEFRSIPPPFLDSNG